jgi:hypothetical protein
MKVTKILFICSMLMSFNLLFGQWSSDPAVNFAVSDLTGSQVIPKIGTNIAGDSYIGWFSQETGNYDVRLQRFDSQGYEMWAHNGILISDHTSMSWLTDWDMIVDAENHAILTFQDIRNAGNNNIYAYRISPDGDFIWGEDGIELSNSAAFDVSPKVTVTGEGNLVIAWSSDGNVIIMHKISPEGNLLWGDNGITLSCENDYTWPQLIPVGTDDVIMKFFEDSGTFPMTTRYVYAQRFDADGNAVWDEDAIISEAGGISVWTQLFPMIPDRNEGFFIAWHDDRDFNNLASIFIQHVDADGNTLFTYNGVEVSTMPNRNHFYPHVAYPLYSEDVFVYWNEMDGSQNLRGIYGQKLNMAGERLWSDYGMAFIELSDTDVFPIRARGTDSDVVVFYEEFQTVLDSHVKAMLIDSDGAYVWDSEHITLCSVSSQKLHPDVNRLNLDQWIVVWEDTRDDEGDIYAQNIQLDGNLGPGSLPGFITGTVTLNGGTGSVIDVEVSANYVIVNPLDDGTYTMVITPGTYDVIASLDGYDPVTVTGVNVEEDQTTEGVDFTLNSTISNDNEITPSTFKLLGNYPNPFNPETTIYFTTTENIGLRSTSPGQAQNTKLSIYNIKGEKVRELPIVTPSPSHTLSVTWNGTDDNGKPVTSGIYFYKLESGNKSSVKKCLLLK